MHISRSLGLDRKTVRKYLGMACAVGITEGEQLPDEREIVSKLHSLVNPQGHERPTLDLVAQCKSQTEELLKDDDMTGKQAWRLLKETHGIDVGYTTISSSTNPTIPSLLALSATRCGSKER